MRVIRSFLAIKLGLPTVESLTETQAQLKTACRSAGATVRWVPPPNIHVTLRFLGQITEPMSHAVKDMLEPIVSETASFDLETVGLGVFPNDKTPRVIWAGLGEGVDVLMGLHDAIYERLQRAGFNFEEKPFSPHVTLGRVKQSPPSGGIAPLLVEDETTNFGVSTIRHFFCYQSELMPSGAEYTAQWVLPFRRKPVIKQSSLSDSPNGSTVAPVRDSQNALASEDEDTPSKGE